MKSRGVKANEGSNSSLYTGGDEVAVAPVTRKVENKPVKKDSNNDKQKESDAKVSSVAKDREKITQLSKEATAAEKAGDSVLAKKKIEEARDILRPHLPKSPDDKWDAVIDRLEVESPKDGAVFWSGSPDKAQEFAKEIGGVTLETTSGGKIIDRWDTGHPWNEDSGDPPYSKDLWGGVSEKFADGISGDVNLVQTPEKLWDPGTIWHNKEKAYIKDKIMLGDVNGIDIHVVKTDGSFVKLDDSYTATLLEYKPVN